MARTRNNPHDDAKALNANQGQSRENSPPLVTNQQQEVAADADNAPVIQQEL